METVFGSTGSMLESIPQPVEEVYIGQTKTLQAIDKEFDKLMMDYRKKPNQDINKHPSRKKIANLVKEQFGFAESFVTFVPSIHQNAYTYDVGLYSKRDNKDGMKLDKKKGYYDKNHALSSNIFITDKILLNEAMEGKHCTAILIHEVGHEFNTSFFTMNRYFVYGLFNIVTGAIRFASDHINEFLKLMGLPTLTTGIFQLFVKDPNNGLGKKMTEYYEECTKDKNVRESIKDQENYRKFISKIANIGINVFILATSTLSKLFSLTMLPLTGLSYIVGALGSDDELHSDEVAAMYGYGPELAKGLDNLYVFGKKNETPNVGANCIRNIGTYLYATLCLVANPENYLTEPHPNYQTRLKNNIDKLREDLEKSDCVPSVKAQLRKDLEDCEKMYEQFISCAGKDKGKIVSQLIRFTTDKLFGGKDIKSLPHTKHI